MSAQAPTRPSLRAVAGAFLRLGTVAFGGPAVHIAMMKDEVVRRRQWLTEAQFLDYLGATNLIPGPNSTELAIHIGHACAGWPGLLVAGVCFILPATLIVGALAWGYVHFGTLPAAAGLLYGMKPVVIAVVLQALWGLGRLALKTRALVLLGLVAVGAAAMGVNQLAILFAAGMMTVIRNGATRVRTRMDKPSGTARTLLMALPSRVRDALRYRAAVASTTTATVAAGQFGLWPLFGVFLKAGAVLFGSGYVLLAFLHADLVQRLGWLTERQLVDAVAIGQVTPGPVFTTATFIGYILGGPVGAGVATAGIFLPAFVFVAVSSVILPCLRRSPMAGAALDGVNVASLALMTVVVYQLAKSALIDPLTIGISVVSVVLLVRRQTNTAWLMCGGGAIGLTVSVIPVAARFWTP